MIALITGHLWRPAPPTTFPAVPWQLCGYFTCRRPAHEHQQAVNGTYGRRRTNGHTP